jgi:uncharacterized membrane protein YgcG
MILALGCVGESDYDSNIDVPAGDPAFPGGQEYGIQDPRHYLSQQTIAECMPILEKLKKDGVVEVGIVIQTGVSHPQDYATHYGRYAKLGEKGRNNGLVWLIRPDVSPEKGRITVSIGRGLPRFGSYDAGLIMEEVAMDYLNFGQFDDGVKILVKRTDESMRKTYGG